LSYKKGKWRFQSAPGPAESRVNRSKMAVRALFFGRRDRPFAPLPRIGRAGTETFPERIPMMVRLAAILLLLAAVAFPAGDAEAKMYKWVDENGVTHFTDTPPPDEVAEDSVSTMPTVTYTPPPETSAGSSRSEAVRQKIDRIRPTPRATSRRGRTPKVEMYSTSWCGYCKKAKAFFQGQGVSVAEYDVEKDKAAAIRMKRLGGGKSVPFVVIGDAKIQGYSEAAYLQALGR
jgi:glutaredoxin